MNFETLQFDSNPEILKDTYMYFNVYENHRALNGSITFIKDPGAFNISHWVTASVQNGKTFKIYNISIGNCEFFEAKFRIKSPIAAAVFNLVQNYITDLPTKCDGIIMVAIFK